MGTQKSAIQATASTEDVRRGYDFRSYVYPWLISPFLEKTKRMASGRAEILPHHKVLEVAIGPGNLLIKIAPLLSRENTLYGVDLSPRMVSAARKRLLEAGYLNHDLREADARKLPFPNEMFDVVLNAYMLDILPLEDIPLVLAEFRKIAGENQAVGGIAARSRSAGLTLTETEPHGVRSQRIREEVPFAATRRAAA